MKVITEQYFNNLVISIVKQKEKLAEQQHVSFTGLTNDELWKEINNCLGNQWTVEKDRQVKFTKADINAVASARFYRKSGIQLLMGMSIIVLALAVIFKNIPNMTMVGYNIFYTLIGAIVLCFLYIYSRKASKVRKELWRQIGRDESEEK